MSENFVAAARQSWKVGGDGPVVLQPRQAVFIAEVK